MLNTDSRNAVCAQARAWLGRNEADGSHRAIIDVYNAHRPAGGYKMTYADPWCAAFVSAVGMAAGCAAILPEVSCDRMIALYRAAGRWIEADDYPAKPGDLIFYDWEDSGAGDNLGSSDHVGIVVSDSDHYFTVIEGNKSDAVGTRTLAHNSRFIRGFAVPDYEGAANGGPGGTPSPSADTSPQADSAPGQAAVVPGAAKTQQDAAKTQQDACTVTLPILRFGDVSEAVRNAQRLLIARGYYCGGSLSYNGKETPDGDFGPATRDSVKLFQSSSEITGDGVIGPQTWDKLINT